MIQTNIQGPHQGLTARFAGKPLAEAKAAMILIHGRGATAQSILELAEVLVHPDFAYIAPQAANHTWYPHSFLFPIEQNEPGRSSGLQVIMDLIQQINDAGIPTERIVLTGFSQGACLVSEFVAQNPQRYGGVLVFSGGVIGPLGMVRHDMGDLAGTPVFLGCSDVDFHIPVERVRESAGIFTKLGGTVTIKIYPNMGHTIIQDEIDQAQEIINQLL